MTTLGLSLLFAAAAGMLPMALARAGRRGVLSRRAIAVAAVGGRDLGDVITHTRDCTEAACLLLAYRHHAQPAFVRRILRDVVTQLDSVERASRLRGALGDVQSRRRSRVQTWPELLLWTLPLLGAGVVARVLVSRGRSHGIDDLRAMTVAALREFSAVARGDGEERFVSLFAEELARLGLPQPDRDPQPARGFQGEGRA